MSSSTPNFDSLDEHLPVDLEGTIQAIRDGQDPSSAVVSSGIRSISEARVWSSRGRAPRKKLIRRGIDGMGASTPHPADHPGLPVPREPHPASTSSSTSAFSSTSPITRAGDDTSKIIVQNTPINPLIPIAIVLMVVILFVILGLFICGLVRHRRRRNHDVESTSPNHPHEDQPPRTPTPVGKSERSVKRSSTLTSFADDSRESFPLSTLSRSHSEGVSGEGNDNREEGEGGTMELQVVIPQQHTTSRRVSFAAPPTPEYSLPNGNETSRSSPRTWTTQLYEGDFYPTSNGTLSTISEEISERCSSPVEMPIPMLVSLPLRTSSSPTPYHVDGGTYTPIRRDSEISTTSVTSSSSDISDYTTATERSSILETPRDRDVAALPHTRIPPQITNHSKITTEIIPASLPGPSICDSPSPSRPIVVIPQGSRPRSETVTTLGGTLEDMEFQPKGQLEGLEIAEFRMSQVVRVEEEIMALQDLLASESGLSTEGDEYCPVAEGGLKREKRQISESVEQLSTSSSSTPFDTAIVATAHEEVNPNPDFQNVHQDKELSRPGNPIEAGIILLTEDQIPTEAEAGIPIPSIIQINPSLTTNQQRIQRSNTFPAKLLARRFSSAGSALLSRSISMKPPPTNTTRRQSLISLTKQNQREAGPLDLSLRYLPHRINLVSTAEETDSIDELDCLEEEEEEEVESRSSLSYLSDPTPSEPSSPTPSFSSFASSSSSATSSSTDTSRSNTSSLPTIHNQSQHQNQGTSLLPTPSSRFSACSWDEYVDSLDSYYLNLGLDAFEAFEEEMDCSEQRNSAAGRGEIKGLELHRFPMPENGLPRIRITSH